MSWSPNRIYHFVVCSRARSRSDSHGQGAPRGPAADGGDGMRVPTFAPSAASSNENLKVVLWHVVERRKLSRDESPTQGELCRFLQANPCVAVYEGQQESAPSPKERAGSAAQACAHQAGRHPRAAAVTSRGTCPRSPRGSCSSWRRASRRAPRRREPSPGQAAGEEGGRAVEDRGDHAARFLIFPTETRLIRSHGFAWACAYSVAIVAYCVLFFILFLCLFTLLNFM
jgi:hypothetical protein